MIADRGRVDLADTVVRSAALLDHLEARVTDGAFLSVPASVVRNFQGLDDYYDAPATQWAGRCVPAGDDD
eukprot:8763400-Alexandrium_andersonii.AAC.1